MVLLSYGVDISEGTLRAKSDTTILGTDALKAVDAARQLGFTGTAKYTLTIAELKSSAAMKKYPIVFVSLLPIDARDDIHALVTIEVSEDEVRVLDPLTGERVRFRLSMQRGG
jgi:ABC-type bacteriocin/lantibiotic exporter with double-glycine peptidase domain